MLSLSETPIRASISHHASYEGAVTARYDTCLEPVCFITFAQMGDDLIITSLGLHPSLPKQEARRGGDIINEELKREAYRLGVKRLLFVRPNQDTAEVIAIYEPQGRGSNTTRPNMYVN